jgi:RHS repeat-associated protein
VPGQELRYTPATAAKKVTRYYVHAGQTIAMRTAADGVIWLSGDHHDTAQISITAVGQSVAIRRQSPFGIPRGTSGTWPTAMDKAFVGGTGDSTGLIHLGAREYDPMIGRFLSVDPMIDGNDPQQMQGYAYADNAPITAADANGLWPNWGKVRSPPDRSSRTTPTKKGWTPRPSGPIHERACTAAGRPCSAADCPSTYSTISATAA